MIKTSSLATYFSAVQGPRSACGGGRSAWEQWRGRGLANRCQVLRYLSEWNVCSAAWNQKSTTVLPWRYMWCGVPIHRRNEHSRGIRHLTTRVAGCPLHQRDGQDLFQLTLLLSSVHGIPSLRRSALLFNSLPLPKAKHKHHDTSFMLP
jgi:hypothetical protein